MVVVSTKYKEFVDIKHLHISLTYKYSYIIEYFKHTINCKL